MSIRTTWRFDRVRRGGSWGTDPLNARAAQSLDYAIRARSSRLGFRLMRRTP